MHFKKAAAFTIIILLTLSGCIMPARLTEEPPPLSTRYAQILQTLTPGSTSNLEQSPQIATTEKPITNTEEVQKESLGVYIQPGVPDAIMNELTLSEDYTLADPEESILQIRLGPISEDVSSAEASTWTYAVVAPFFTLTDQISFEALQALWQGDSTTGMPFTHILVTKTTHSAISELLGPPDSSLVNQVSHDTLVEKSLSNEQFLAIIPFEDLSPQFKIIRVDGTSPVDSDFDPDNYKLSVRVWLDGARHDEPLFLPPGNFQADRKTNLVMTGVTALTRATAFQMAMHGETFPGQDIRNWLLDADITHISHEVPFAENCPDPDPVQENLIFCAAPERIALLEDIGTDVIELSGNHLLDYGDSAARLTIQMYQNRGWATYAGGMDLSEAQTPTKITHHGNKLAFIGCNLPGPPNVWATASKPGAAPCGDYQWLEEAINQSLAEGFLPIVTLQYNEDYSAIPGAQMERDFLRLADAGAVVVNGSQAHTPKIMGFHRNSFLHFGLGNLFFDQMEVYYQDILMEGTRDEFIDRLIFYDNRLVSVEFLTAKLEDYARPRPMTVDERKIFLSRIFDLAVDAQLESAP